MSKQCPFCKIEKPVDDFYIAYKDIRATLCKTCHKFHSSVSRRNTHPKKLTGFAKLPDEVRENILSDIADGFITFKQIANKNKIVYNTFIRWKTKGLIV
jgi:hypothetical protein